ncbi:MAG TPA: LysR family transcriptional regulator [Chthoniobacterales bacterium]
MVNLEWFRSFVAVYQARNITSAAAVRSLTQPAVSQHLAALEAALGRPVFIRSSRGVTPTAAGAALYREVFEAVARLERSAYRFAAPNTRAAPVRLSVPVDFFACWVLPRLGREAPELVVSLFDAGEHAPAVERGDVDAAITNQRPGGRLLACTALCTDHYVLVGPKSLVLPDAVKRPVALGAFLAEQSWISYSEDLPITRRFWQQTLGQRFSADLRLVMPDLRTVLQAVVQGLGCSLLPRYVCARALAEGTVQELWSVEAAIPAEHWHLVYRLLDVDRLEMMALERCLQATCS